MKQNLKPSLENIQACSAPDICSFCGKRLELPEPNPLKRKSIEDLRCKCGELACWCGKCGNIYFPKDSNDLKCPACGGYPLNQDWPRKKN